MIEGTIPCSVCGEYPKLYGGNHKRLACPNYKSEKIQHGNLNPDTNGIPKGFTEWNCYCWTEEQTKEALKDLIAEWNKIHMKK